MENYHSNLDLTFDLEPFLILSPLEFSKSLGLYFQKMHLL